MLLDRLLVETTKPRETTGAPHRARKEKREPHTSTFSIGSNVLTPELISGMLDDDFSKSRTFNHLPEQTPSRPRPWPSNSNTSGSRKLTKPVVRPKPRSYPRQTTMRSLQSTIIKASLLVVAAFVLMVNYNSTVKSIPYLEISNDNPAYVTTLTQPLVRYGHLLGSLIGVNIRWRMFAPVDIRNWRVHFVGIGSNKKPVSDSPLYWETSFDSPWTLSHLLKFRERKANLNAYHSQTRLGVMARQVCVIRSAEFPNLAAVTVEYQFQNITASPEDPRIPTLGEWMPWQPFDTFLCP